MATTRNKRVPMQEQIKLINECRKSGDIQEPNYGHHETPQPKQDVVSVDIIPDEFPESSAVVQPQTPLNLDNSHTIEVVVNDITIRITNSADPILLTQTIKLLRMLPY